MARQLTPEIERLERRRHEIARRIGWLHPNAARRKLLQRQQTEITQRLLRLEMDVRDEAEPQEGQELKWFQK